MRTQCEAIIGALAKRGWAVIERAQGDVWWADEIVTLESAWAPVGQRLYLTFLVDPMNLSSKRKPGEAVWAVTLSEAPLEERNALTVSLRGWEKELPALVAHAEHARASRTAPRD